MCEIDILRNRNRPTTVNHSERTYIFSGGYECFWNLKSINWCILPENQVINSGITPYIACDIRAVELHYIETLLSTHCIFALPVAFNGLSISSVDDVVAVVSFVTLSGPFRKTIGCQLRVRQLSFSRNFPIDFMWRWA